MTRLLGTILGRASFALSVLVLVVACSDVPSPPPAVTQVTPEAHERWFPLLTGPHAGTDCNACHGGFQTFTEFSCLGCHPEPTTTPIHTAVRGYAHQPMICIQCHPRGEKPAVKPAEHARFYPIALGTTHEALRCRDCHLDPLDARVVSCTDCHDHAEATTRTQHAGIDAYVWETKPCLQCHRDGDDPARIAHESWFPIAPASAHAAIACRSCHPEPQRTIVACAGCHDHRAELSTPQHVAVGGYAANADRCLRCHDRAEIHRVAEHLPFRIQARADHGPANAGCLECHLESTPERPWSASFSRFDCTACHLERELDGEHDDENGYRYESATCVLSGCHPDGQKP